MVANSNLDKKETMMNFSEIKPIRNPYLIETKVEEDFFLITNPCIIDGFKLININQYAILEKIDNQKTIADIANLTSYTKAEIKQVCDILSKKEIVNYTNTFSKPEKSNNVKSLALWVHTTNNCCLRCSYCYIPTLGQNDYLSEENIKIFCKKLIQSAKAHQLSYISLRLAGGEPFLKFDLWKPYLVRLKQELKDVGCELWLTFLTNAVLLTDEIIDFVMENSFGIGVSMDGLSEYQDNTRHFKDGTGSFKIVSKNILRLQEKKCRHGIMTVISNKNLDGLVDFTQYIIENSLSCRFSLVKKEEINIVKTIDTLTRCYELFDKAIDNGYNFSKYHNLGDLKFGTPSIQTCSNAVNAAALYSDGSIYFCHRLFGDDTPQGTIFEDSDLLEIFQRKTYYFDYNPDCQKCPYFYICMAGCPLNRINNKDAHCEIYKVVIPQYLKLLGKERLKNIIEKKNQ